MPSRCACAFIICANASSLPAISSASAMHASLPDCTIMPRINSSTVTGFLGSMNVREPSAFHARSDTGTGCVSWICFCFNAAKVRYAVISLVSDAGSTRSSAACAASACWL
jgi:hypothetical protein